MLGDAAQRPAASRQAVAPPTSATTPRAPPIRVLAQSRASRHPKRFRASERPRAPGVGADSVEEVFVRKSGRRKSRARCTLQPMSQWEARARPLRGPFKKC